MQQTEATFTFSFVLHKGNILPPALLLAVSLSERCHSNANIVAAIPGGESSRYCPEKEDLKFLEKLGISIFYFENPRLHSSGLKPTDWYANKIYACRQEVSTTKFIFLDSDMLCLRQPEFSDSLIDVNFCARAAGRAHVGMEHWEKLYPLFGLPVPCVRAAGLSDGVFVPPYFNSGMFMLDSRFLRDFSYKWEDSFDRISNSGILSGPVETYTDQAALAIAIQRMSMSYFFLDEQYNYRSGQKDVVADDLPFLAHYHSPEKLYRDPVLRKRVRSSMNRHSLVADRVGENSNWNRVFGGVHRYWMYRLKRFVALLLSQLKLRHGRQG